MYSSNYITVKKFFFLLYLIHNWLVGLEILHIKLRVQTLTTYSYKKYVTRGNKSFKTLPILVQIWWKDNNTLIHSTNRLEVAALYHLPLL